MEELPTTNDLIRCAVQVIGRCAIPEDKVREIVGPGKKQIAAYNLCDAQFSLSEIAKKAKIDQGNFSRTVKRWVQEGVVFWVGKGKGARLMHIYPITASRNAASKKSGVKERP